MWTCVSPHSVLSSYTVSSSYTVWTSFVLRYTLRMLHNEHFLKSYSQTFPEIMFTCISDPNFFRVPPNWVCFRMSRPYQGYMYVCPTYGTWSTMTSRCDGVDETVNVCTGFTYMYMYMYMYLMYFCACRTCTCICFIFHQSVMIFTAMPNILCACNIFVLMKSPK